MTDNKPKTPEDESSIKSKVKSLVASLSIIEVEKEHMKDIVKSLKEDHGYAPKVSRKVAKKLFKDTAIEDARLEEKIQELETLVT